MFLEKCYLSKKSLSAVALMCAVLNTTVYSMDPPKKSYITGDITLNQFESFNTGYITDRSSCNMALEKSRLWGEWISDDQTSDMRGGNSIVSSTKSNQWVVKRAYDANANDEKKNEIRILRNINDKLGNISFNNLSICKPYALFNIKDPSGKLLNCNIQISPKCQGQWDMGNFVRSLVPSWKNETGISPEENYKVIELLGSTLAEFQTIELHSDFSNLKGRQHGDFNLGNIRVDLSEGKYKFTLIDIGDFKQDGHLICDPISFIYFCSYVLREHTPTYAPSLDEYNKIMPQIINRFYSGYVKNLNENACHKMSEIFNAENLRKNGPLECALKAAQYPTNDCPKGFRTERTDYIGYTGKRIKDPAKIRDLETWQQNGFNAAYNKRFPNKSLHGAPKMANSAPLDKSYSAPSTIASRNIAAPVPSLQLDRRTIDSANLSLLQYAESNNVNVKTLVIENCNINAIKPLQLCPNLTNITLKNTLVEWVGSLRTLTKLKTLDLSGNINIKNLKESGLNQFGLLKNLEVLNLQGTNLSREDIEKLERLLKPINCVVLSNFN